MSSPLQLKGKVFGRLTVVKQLKNSKCKRTMWECRCSCGKKTISLGATLTSGGKRSCGCLMVESIKKARQTHKMSGTRIYSIWNNMRSRCQNENRNDYKYYIGKGIGVCKRWHKFESFYKDMGSSYKKGLELDRVDNSKGYSKRNCRWVTRKQNMRNTDHNVVYNGLCLVEWCELLKVRYHTMLAYKKKYSMERAVNYYMNCKKVKNSLGQVFETQAEASRKTGILKSNINSCLRGKKKSAGKDKNGNKIYWSHYS